ncbi:putative membrane protein [Variovorax boronicumulans]|nr:putative membrane protein [Variovorax boronicumulans]
MATLICIDAMWLATEPIDMRTGTETALARVVKVFGAAHPDFVPACKKALESLFLRHMCRIE